MTYYSGFKAIGFEASETAYGNPDIGNYPDPRDSLYSALVISNGEADRGSTQPIEENRAHRSASKQDQFGFLDFFNRIHIQYRHLDLGNIISTQQVNFTVFNSYFVPRTLNEIVESGITGGLVLTEPAPTPLVFQPFEQYVYQLSVSTEGPPSVAATYLFDFDVIDLQLDVTGTRLVLFYFEPDGPMNETLEWATDILESYDGSEQRIELRGAPRQRIEFDVLTDGIDDTKLRGLLFDWLPRVFGLPIWWEMRRVTSAPTAGDGTINVSTLNGDFREGGLMMIYQDKDKYEVIGITSMDSTSIKLDTDLTNSYTRKAVVIPVRTAYAAPNANRSVTTTNLARTSVAFTTLDNENLASSSGANTYLSKALLDDANFSDSNYSEQFQTRIFALDTVTGNVLQVTGWDQSKILLKKRWEVTTAADLWRIRRLLHSFHGNRVSFWLPSFRNDLQVNQTIAAGTPSIRIDHCGYTQTYKGRVPYTDIRVILNDGTSYVRRIIGSNVDGVNEVLTLNAPLSASPILVDDIERTEFVQLVRINNDRAKLTHVRAGTATIEINVTAVKE